MSFVRTSGKIFTLDGRPWRPFGASIYGSTNTTANMQLRVDDALSCNFTMIRLINVFSGDPLGQNTEAVWARIDYILDACKDTQIKVMIDCSDFCGYLINSLGITPEDQDWDDYLTFLLNRVNTVNGRVYKNDDTIAMFTIAGELPTGYNAELPGFYSTVSAMFKSKGAQQLICTGGLNWLLFDSIGAISTIDCMSYHGYFPLHGGSSVESQITSIQTQSASVNKPWFVEEFGGQSKGGDNNVSRYFFDYYRMGFKYGSAGMLYWNLYPSNFPPGGDDYNVGPGGGLPQTNSVVKLFSYMTAPNPRISVYAADNANWVP